MRIESEIKNLRQQALDPATSFLVQAPAGSGKTELLTQRFLKLLTEVNSPEEIIAITFTRKAANEMRNRILNALEKSQTEKALEILQNPNRLRILTIDALAASLCPQTPNVTEDPTTYYRQAIENLLTLPETHPYIETLLLHLENNFNLLEKLLLNMLSKRDQWLPHIIDHHRNPQALKNALEEGLSAIVQEKMLLLKKSISEEIAHSLVDCAIFASQHVDAQHPLTACATLTQLPETDITDFSAWKGLANLLLTQTGQWRKQVNKTSGFPPPEEAPHESLKPLYQMKKQQMQTLLKIAQEDSLLHQRLVDVQQCPPTHFNVVQWDIIHALVYLLPLLAAELQLVFKNEGITDFNEITQNALRALGDAATPSELALHLDYQIRHLLIDEFQDTSVTQLCLFEQLMRGWQLQDGRTLFLVGDPMQSIYRFRQAEVGLFLRAKLTGVNHLPLKTITLTENFRSRPEIIHWINQTFRQIFPQTMDIMSGAVPYSPVQATKESAINAGIYFYSLLNATEQHEAHQVTQIVQSLIQKNPQQKVAILVRSRQSFTPIIAALREAEISFHAVDTEPLHHRPEIQDLLSLTRALTHLGDRIAWLAILRAPWCGLTLQDLHAIVQHNPNKIIWSSLVNYNQIANLSADGRARLRHIVPILTTSFHSQTRLPLSAWIEGAWIALGGPATLPHEIALKNTQQFIQLLTEINDHFSIENLMQKLEKKYAQIDNDLTSSVQLMTIHKAKGLEFDHVILPSLHRKVSADPQHLLLWMECPSLYKENNLMLAPIKAASEDHEPIYQYLKMIEKNKALHETQRLLYVAATRAKETLHLVSTVLSENENDLLSLKKPAKGSFLDILWPVCYADIIKNILTFDNPPTSPTQIKQQLERLLIE